MLLNYKGLETLKVGFMKDLMHRDKKHPYMQDMKDYIAVYEKTKVANRLPTHLKLLFLEYIAKNNPEHPDIIFLEQYINSFRDNSTNMTPELYFTSIKEFKPEVLGFLKMLRDI